MIRFHHHSNVSNHIISYFCGRVVHRFVLQMSPKKRAQKLPLSIAFSIERSRNCACFCAFRHLVFENQSVFGHNINMLFYSRGLLIAFFQILWAIIGWKTFLVSSFSGHWTFTDQFTSDVIMAQIIGRANPIAAQASWPLPPGWDVYRKDEALPLTGWSEVYGLEIKTTCCPVVNKRFFVNTCTLPENSLPL